MRLSIVAAIANNGVIGIQNQMPWYLPEDLKNFKVITMGKPILMGRKTFDSLGGVLPGRENIVISRRKGFSPKDCVIFKTVEDAISAYSSAAELMVIGGASIYEHLLPSADRLYLTKIRLTYEGDTYFPIIKKPDWVEITKLAMVSWKGVSYTYSVLDRIKSAA